MISVLYVDDEPGLLEITKIFLEKDGEFKVTTVLSAEEALSSPQLPGYDAIVSDYHMGGMDGIAFLKAVRERYGDLPFILFTGRGREDVVIDAINNGVDFYLQKGGDPAAQFAELKHKIRKTVTRRQAELLRSESEKRLADIINFLPDATFAIDRGGHVIAWNRAIEEMTGIPASEMLGKGNFEYAVPFYGTRRKILIDLIFETNDVIAKDYSHIIHDKDILIADTSLPRPKGRAVTLMGKASPLYDRGGNIVGAIESIRDITDREIAQDALLHAKKDWETIFRAIGHPAFVLDPGYRILDVNDATIRATGRSLEELKGKYCYEIFHKRGTTGPVHSCPCGKLTITGQTTTEELEVEGLNGYYAVTCTPVYDEEGRLEKVIHIAMDITLRKQAESELRAAYEQLAASEEELKSQYEELARSEQRTRESESRFRDLAELLPQMVFEMDSDLRITYANQRALTTMGLSQDDLARGVNALSFLDAKDHKRARAALERLVRGEPDEDFEYTAIRTDGSIFPALIYTALIHRAGKIAGFRGVLIDISARKKDEEALRQANVVVENSPVVLFRWKAEEGWPVAYVSQNVARFGYSAEELLAGTVPYSSLVHPGDLERIAREVHDYAERGIDQFPQEYRILTKDGRIRWIDDRTTIERDPSGEITHYQGIVIDITDRRQAQDAARDQEATLASIFRAAPTGIGMVVNRVITKVNNRLCEMTGYSADDLIGKSARILYPTDEDFEYVGREKYDQIRQYGTGTVQTRWQRKEGSIRDILLSSTPIDPVDPAKGVTFTALDITEQKQAEQIIRENEEKYRTLIETTATGYVIIDREGCVLDANPEYVRLTGHSSLSEIRGRNVIEWTAENEREKNAQAVLQCIRNGFIRNFEIDYTDNSGTITPVEINASVIRSGNSFQILTLCRDISERRRAQKALLESEERYRVIVETADEGIWSIDTGFATTFTNRKMQELFGYTAEEMLGRPVWDFVPPDDIESMQEELAKRPRGIPGRYERRWVRKDGTFIWCLTSATPLFSSDGTFAGSFGMFTDITNRKEIEEALHESEAKYRTVVEQSNDAIFIAQDGLLVFHNPAFAELTGYADAELTERPIADMIAPEDRNLVLTRHRERLSGGPLSHLPDVYEFSVLHHDGTSRIRVIMHVSPSTFRGRPATIGTLHNVTEERKREEALRGSEENYRMLIEHVQDVIYRSDCNGILVMASPSFLTLLGYDSLEECIGRNIADQFWMEPSRRQEFLDELRTRGSISGYEVILKKKDGSPVIISASSHFYYGKDGNVAGIEGIFHDITAIRKAEQEISLLASLNDISPASVTVHTPEGEMLYANQRTFDMHGWTRDEFMALNLHQIDVPESEELIELRIIELRKTGETSFDVEHYRKDGSRFPLHVKAKMVRWNERDVVLSVSTDISERKNAEAALRTSEERFREIVEQSTDVFYRQNIRTGRFEYFSPNVVKVLGYTPKEMIAMEPDEQQGEIHQEDLPRLLTFADDLVAADAKGENTLEREFRIRHKQGEYRWIHGNYTLLRDAQGSPSMIIGSLHDITDRKLAEGALLESEARLQSILQGSPVLQFAIDNTHKVISWNKAIEEYSGISAAEIIGTDRQWRAFYHQQRPVLADLLVDGDMDGLSTWYGKKLQKSRYVEGAYEATDFFPHMGSTGKWLAFTAAPIRDAEGSIIGAVETLEDITERREMESTIREVNRKLTLLNSITRHDVTNQLTVLQGFAKIAAMKETDPVVADLLGKIDASAQTISRQIEFTRTYQDLGIHTPDWFLLDDIVERTKREVVKYSGTCRHAEIFADPLLDRVFFNLFDNAIRHGGRVTEVTVRCERAPDGLVITIEDDGIGIPPAEKEKIFEKGYGKHTGFGLFLAREILAITGSTIRETGYQGIGARFEITVPVGKYRFHPMNNSGEAT